MSEQTGLADGCAAFEMVVVLGQDVAFRGRLERSGDHRLSDEMNRTCASYPTFHDVTDISHGCQRGSGQRRVCRSLIDMVIAEHAAAGTSGRRKPRHQMSVRMWVGRYWLDGTVHVPIGRSLVEYLAGARENTFVPVTKVAIRRAGDDTVIYSADLTLVRRDRLSAEVLDGDALLTDSLDGCGGGGTDPEATASAAGVWVPARDPWR